MIIRKIATMLLRSIDCFPPWPSERHLQHKVTRPSIMSLLETHCAAGQKPTAIGSTSAKLYGTSYPKFIRDDLSSNGLLNSYANFGVSGYKTWASF